MKRRRAPPNPAHMAGVTPPPSAKQNSLSLSHSTQLKALHSIMDSQTLTQTDSSQTFFTAYGPKLKVTLDCPPGFGRTKQSFKDDSDINNIVARFKKTGVMDFAARNEPRYGDAVSGTDFQTAMNVIAQAKSMFAELPAGLRGKFENDPAKFLDFVHDEENEAQMRELGLLKPVVTPAFAKVTPPPSSARRGACSAS